MNSTDRVSRRGFFGRAVTGSAAGVAGQLMPLPSRAWTIMAINWEYDDECSFQEGERACGKIYFDEQEAQAACQKLCDEFFTESPEEFGVRWEIYELDPDTATWNDLREAGFPDPYYVLELKT